MGMSNMSSKLHSWQQKFAVLMTGQAVSIFTSSVIQMAIVWYLTDRTGSAAILTSATLVGFLPQAVLGPFIGVLIDRYDRKKIMIYADIFIALVTMILVVYGSFADPPIWLILMVLFFRGIGSTFHKPSMKSVIPLIVPEKGIVRCAGYSHTFDSISLLFSPAVAAILYGVLDVNIILLFDVAGAILAVIAINFVNIPSVKREDSLQNPNIFNEAKEGFDVLRSEPGLMSLLFISMLYAIIYFPIGTLYPLITMTYFGGAVGDSSIDFLTTYISL